MTPYYVTLKLSEDESQCQRKCLRSNTLQMKCIGHALEAPGLYQQTLF